VRNKPKHGLSYEPEYRAWQTMRLRCHVPSNAAFPSYGGRGITVCARWLSSVAAFMEDVGKKPTPAHEIDRINNDGGYWCGKAECADCGPTGRTMNVRWVTRSENSRNRRNNRVLEISGVRRPVVEWCELHGINADVFGKRIEIGWGVEKALTTPVRVKSPKGHGKYSRVRSPARSATA